MAQPADYTATCTNPRLPGLHPPAWCSTDGSGQLAEPARRAPTAAPWARHGVSPAARVPRRRRPAADRLEGHRAQAHADHPGVSGRTRPTNTADARLWTTHAQPGWRTGAFRSCTQRQPAARLRGAAPG